MTSSTMHDTIIIGAGHNALVAAFYLAKAGRRPLVLEKQAHVGGGAVTAEIHPGFKCPSLSHEILLDEQIVNDLDLKRQALAQVFPDVLAPPRGGHLLLDGRDLVGWLRRM